MRVPCAETWLICQNCIVPLDIVGSTARCPRCETREFDRLTCHHNTSQPLNEDSLYRTPRCPAHARHAHTATR